MANWQLFTSKYRPYQTLWHVCEPILDKVNAKGVELDTSHNPLLVVLII